MKAAAALLVLAGCTSTPYAARFCAPHAPAVDAALVDALEPEVYVQTYDLAGVRIAHVRVATNKLPALDFSQEVTSDELVPVPTLAALAVAIGERDPTPQQHVVGDVERLVVGTLALLTLFAIRPYDTYEYAPDPRVVAPRAALIEDLVDAGCEHGHARCSYRFVIPAEAREIRLAIRFKATWHCGATVATRMVALGGPGQIASTFAGGFRRLVDLADGTPSPPRAGR